MEIITGVERRRRWSAAEKLRIVAETEQPGAGIAEIARRYEVSRGLLWNWRSLVRRGVLRPEPQAVFVPVQVISEPSIAERCQCRLNFPQKCRLNFPHFVDWSI
jgi:transposase-like protein